MGNCLVMEKKVIKIVRDDGKVLEYREPISVHHILTQFSGHSISHNNTHLLPDAKLLSGRLYYLLPTTMTKKKVNKKVTFANPEVEGDERLLREEEDSSESNSNIDGDDTKNVTVVRMKIVVHKQELEKLLQGGSVHEMMYQTLEKQLLLTSSDDDDLECNSGWRPALDSIPESESLRRT
ncbi:hypothetical protein AtNW77_Chr5g0086781 [Arabidopsis thaliana]|uniref:Emb/CAB85509.1 n=4 Tax=Arabidopsis TaxID=3701 RepID=Q9LZC0_ARATH|nr:uncharacterized protein AT5G03890 [Arabidopsis thaliana]KAG7601078.1 hypothetical protein ISN45_At05g002950 [Arabidopsis thaliana x Arabidopsis arenosa]AED90667.1 hypothetical protein AT5G03890 [Arabidopsis thaliana]OAO89571.1 hypothetical protein AXX17_AT5G03230 [Arabidopsis thaliana]CAA0400506.1 unnamed protein product [Arabidopsis thaliana]CAB85509.1 putative protein [Arabidopsis thaliana]|eukprot:NP_196009.1 hypothetical protein AT5G03890 [Arabidopsis thaliana]